MLTGAWVMYGFDTAGGLAEETVNPSREVPRAMLFAIGITAVISAFWLVAMVLAIPDVAKTQAQSTGAIAYIFNAHFPSLGHQRLPRSRCASRSSSAAWPSRRRRRGCSSPTAATR